MSQSDYIQRKKISYQVASKNRTPIDKGDNPPILSSQLLTLLKQYDLENTIVNTRPRFNQLVPSTTLRVREMNLQQPINICKTYRTCNGDAYNSNSLPTTVAVKTFYDVGLGKPFVNPHSVSPYK